MKKFQVKAYTEEKLFDLVKAYARRNHLTQSQAARALLIEGLKIDKARRLASQKAEVEYLAGLAS